MDAPFLIPKPRDWSTFEAIVADVFSRKYENYNLQRYGRNGQGQDGVDIVGPIATGMMLGVQCKHHPAGDIKTDEIDKEVEKSEGFRPQLNQYVIATSAERDAKAHAYVLQISEEREQQGKYPVSIMFWDDICAWLSEFPELVYMHFTRHYPQHEREQVHVPGIDKPIRQTLSWPITAEQLEASTNQSIGNVQRLDPYQLAVGVTSFPDSALLRLVDVHIDLAEYFLPEGEAPDLFVQAAEILRTFRTIVTPPLFSKEIVFHPQLRLTGAFLLGWMFRRVSGYRLLLIHRQDVWASRGLPHVPSLLAEGLPTLLNAESREVALGLNITRDIQASVVDWVQTWGPLPRAVLSYRLETNVVTSAAHALSLSFDIARKIKNLVDNWGVTHIHLFGAMPAALAVLIGHNLNAICPISIYYLGGDRQTYQLGGTIDNRL